MSTTTPEERRLGEPPPSAPPSEPPPRLGTRARSRSASRAEVGAAIAVLGLTVLRIVLLWPLTTPWVVADETGFLFQARFLAHVGAKPSMGSASFYPPLYGVLLTPVTWLTRAAPGPLYRGAQTVNVLLFVVGFVLLLRIAREVFALRPVPAVMAATAASAYPAYLLQSGLAWPEALLPVLFTALVLACHRVERTRSLGAAAAAGALAVAMYATHQRAILLPALAVVGLAYLGWRRELDRRTAAVAVAITIALTLVTQLAFRYTQHALWTGTPDRESSALHTMLSVSGWLQIVRASWGMTWYLLAATFGLTALGSLQLLRGYVRGRARFATVGTLAATAGLVFTAATFMRGPTRADHYVYGRYDEIVVGVLLVAAVAAFVDGWPRLRLVPILGGSMLLLAVGLALAKGNELEHLGVVIVNVLGIMAMRDLVMRNAVWNIGIRVVPITLVSIAGLALLLVVARRWWQLSVALLTIVFVASAIQTRTAVDRASDVVDNSHTLSAVASRLVGHAEIAYDTSSADLADLYVYQYWLPHNRFVVFDSRHASPPTDVVIASTHWSRAAPLGARLAFVENTVDDALWVLPGARQARMQADGQLLPAGFPGPLPATAYRSRVSVSRAPTQLRRGDAVALRLDVRNAGSGSPWVQGGTVLGDNGAVDVVAVWDVDGTLVQAPGSADLPRTVYPGESVTTTYWLRVPSVNGTLLAPGRYRVGFVPEQQGVARFDARGDQPSWITVDITG